MNTKGERLQRIADAVRDGGLSFLDVIDKAVIASLLADILAGVDVRAELGIEPKGGRRSKNAGKHQSIAGEYLALRATEPDIEEIGTATEVAERWDVSLTHVRDCAKRYRQQIERRAEHIGWDMVLFYATLPTSTKQPQAKKAAVQTIVRSKSL
jgi:hypothetical protein